MARSRTRSDFSPGWRAIPELVKRPEFGKVAYLVAEPCVRDAVQGFDIPSLVLDPIEDVLKRLTYRRTDKAA